MVNFVDFKKRTNKEGENFNALILTGGIDLVKSKETGNYYATSRKASISCTFDDLTCQELIGQKLPGSVQRVPCEPYEYVNKETGEVIQMTTRNVYLKEGETLTI